MISSIIGGGTAVLFGTSLINDVVSGTLRTLYGTLAFLKNGSVSPDYIIHIETHIRRLDIQMKVDLVTYILAKNPSGAESIIVKGLKELVDEIDCNLKTINLEIDTHQHKWFASYRGLNVDIHLTKLAELVQILDGRLALLSNLLNQT